MDHQEVDRILRRQSGVISRRQVREFDGRDADIARMLRRRAWRGVHPGVYVNHTGPLTWEQRAWAAVLVCWPAALGASAALRAHGLTGPLRATDDADIDVVIDEARRVSPPPGVRLQRISHYEQAVQRNLSLPRVRVEHAVLTLSSRARTADAAVAVIGDACQSGRTTPDRLVRRLAEQSRLPRRALILEILADVADGAVSALERRYLSEVERAHGLPLGRRQQRVDNEVGVTYRDVEYADQNVIVELDGRLGHEWSSDRWRDLDRDLAGAVDGSITLRLGWKQTLEPCRLAGSMARLLRSRGWTRDIRACGSACTAVSGGSQAPGDGDPPMSPAA